GPNPSLNSLGKDPSWKEDGEEIATESLDQVLHQVGIDRVDVIKMDVQGAEELVLRGASNVLTSVHPVIIFEIWPEGTTLLGISRIGEKSVSRAAGEVAISTKSYGFPAGPADSNVTSDSLEIALCPWSPCHRERQPVGCALVPPSAVARRGDDHDLCRSRALR